MSRYPLVTAIVCTHDRPQVLPRALDSLLAQSLDDFEVIVIHDGPPDDETKRICEEYVDRFATRGVEMNFMSTSEASGYYCVPRNMAICHARGDYIYHLDDDNAAKHDALEAMVGALREGTVWPDFVYGLIDYKFHPGAPKVHKWRTLPEGMSTYQPWDADLGQESVALRRLAAGFRSNFIDSSSFMASRGAYYRLALATEKMFNESYRRAGDWELVTRAVFYAGWRGRGIEVPVVDYYWGTPGQIQLSRHFEGVKAEVVK